MIGQAHINILTVAKIVGVPDLDGVERGDKPLLNLKQLMEHLQPQLKEFNLP